MFEYYGCPRQSCPFRNRVRCQPGFYYDTENNYNRCVGCQQNYYCPGGLGSGAFQSTCPPGHVPNSQKTGCSIEEKVDPEPDTNTSTDGLVEQPMRRPGTGRGGVEKRPGIGDGRKKTIPVTEDDMKRPFPIGYVSKIPRPIRRSLNEVDNSQDTENYYYFRYC
jgi:hypothetical protein